jgi:putative DNA primase/helicase
VSAVEAEAGQRIAEAKLKQLTGGDRIAARFLYGEHFEFVPQFKLWLATNRYPEVRGTDEGIWRRFRVIPFNVTIPEAERDGQLPDKLRGELSGILNWAIEGCLAWQNGGLQPPAMVTNATKDYRAEMDVMAQFLADECARDRSARVSSPDIYKAYSTWCSDNGESPLKQREFGKRLKEHGFEQTRGKNGVRGWRGIRLRDVPEQLALEPGDTGDASDAYLEKVSIPLGP